MAVTVGTRAYKAGPCEVPSCLLPEIPLSYSFLWLMILLKSENPTGRASVSLFSS